MPIPNPKYTKFRHINRSTLLAITQQGLQIFMLAHYSSISSVL